MLEPWLLWKVSGSFSTLVKLWESKQNTIATKMNKSSDPSLEIRYLHQSRAATQIEASRHTVRLVHSNLEAKGRSDWSCCGVELIDQ